MRFSIFTVLAAGGLVAGAPRKRDKANPFEVTVLGGASFRVPQVANTNYRTAHRGPRELAKAYQKYGVEIPADLRQVLVQVAKEFGLSTLPASRVAQADNDTTEGDQGEVSAIPQIFDIEYLAEVQIGTPPQTLMLNFDTGSSDLWVFSSETPAQQVNGQKLYDIEASTSAKLLNGSTWSIRYGDGSSSSGTVYTDTVSVGKVTVDNQAVESAKTVSASFTSDAASSGLLGLAFSHINTVVPNPQKTFFENAVENLAMPLFSANLKKGKAGNYNFGFIDDTEFDGELTFIDVNSTQGFWQFTTTGFSVDGGETVSSPHEAIADTGTTLLLVPPEVANAYYEAVPSAQYSASVGGIVYHCDEVLPDFALEIGEYTALVPGGVINYAPADADTFEDATYCFGGIQAASGLPFAIYGDIFLKGQFVVFHGGNEQLGFAPKPI